MIFDLSKCQWEIKGYYPWVPLKDRSMETGKELMGITEWIPARVPGGIHYDLYRAGLIRDPYQDMESFRCEWVENRWWLYRTVVGRDKLQGSYHTLVFQGIDYEAIIYINGKERCRHEGMYDPVRIDITKEAASGADLEIKVLLMHAPDEMGQIGKTSRTFTQKSRFNYKWDFSARLVNLGIWEKCYIQSEEGAVWAHPHIVTDYKGAKGYVYVTADIQVRPGITDALEAVAVLENRDGKWQQKLAVSQNHVSGVFVIENPALWYPNGYGNQELYRLKLSLQREEQELDSYEIAIGIRSIAYRQNEESPEDAMPYTFCINGEPVYVKGVNMTPLDHIYGNVSDQHYECMVRMMKNMNVNMVRIWGGGIIEKDSFYRLCDKYGILIWQEFIQSSSGLDNIPSKRPEFLLLLSKTARAAVLSRRNHTALMAWSGGNELTDEAYVPAGYGDENIAMLKEIVEMLDPGRIFLPTSASGPREFVTEEKGVSHDIHGNWNYMGNPGHYELYAESDSLFHSEFGAEGMCSARSLDRFLSKKYQTLQPAKENMAYRHHGEWWCTYQRDRAIFGTIENMEQYTKCSQWMQAEGLRFILEANRRRKFHNSGSIIWQLNEPWPNVSCTSLVDYYLEQKMAYYWGKTAFADLAVSLDYRKLDYKPGEVFHGVIYAGKETLEEDMKASIACRVRSLDGEVLCLKQWQGVLCHKRTIRAMDLDFVLPDTFAGMFLVQLYIQMAGRQVDNTYFFSCGSSRPYDQALQLPKGRLSVSMEEEGGRIRARLSNTGEVPLLHIHPYSQEGFYLLCDKSYITLLPEESAEIEITCVPAFDSGFLRNKPVQGACPDIRFDYFNS